MAPRNRNSENQGLPKRWRIRHGAYYYQVPPGQEGLWDGKKEFRLGKNLADAYRAYADRIENPDEVRNMRQLIAHYRMNETPKKALKTQKSDHAHLDVLERVFGDTSVVSIGTQECYKLYAALRQKRALSTSNKIMEIVSHLMTVAIRLGLRSDHPMTNRKFVKENPVSKRHVPEMSEISEALKCANDTIKLYVKLKVMTGLRMTDMLSLKRTDVHEKGIFVQPSKTKNSSGKAIIIEWDDEGVLFALISKIKSQPRAISSGYLFCTRRGQPYIKEDKSTNAFQSMWQRWQKKALAQGLIEIKFSEKAIRNRVGTDLDSDEDAKKLLAHSNVQTTKKFYRLNPDRVKPNTKKSIL